MGDAAWDVVVIGAGPGGGTAALHCARLGLNTLILEEHKQIGVPVHCGECLSELAVQNLELDLPEEVISLHVEGIRVLFPNNVQKKLTELPDIQSCYSLPKQVSHLKQQLSF